VYQALSCWCQKTSGLSTRCLLTLNKLIHELIHIYICTASCALYICTFEFPYFISHSPYIYCFHLCSLFISVYIHSHIFALGLLYMCPLTGVATKKNTHNRTQRDDNYSIYFCFSADFTMYRRPHTTAYEYVLILLITNERRSSVQQYVCLCVCVCVCVCAVYIPIRPHTILYTNERTGSVQQYKRQLRLPWLRLGHLCLFSYTHTHTRCAP
jgi:hypothetical protein